MSFPVELDLDRDSGNLVLHVSSLEIFGDRPVVVPADKTQKLRFFSLTSEYRSSVSNYTIQEIETELARLGIDNANAYRVLRKKRFTKDKPFIEMETTTFRAYHVPEDLAQRERKNSLDLASCCTS